LIQEVKSFTKYYHMLGMPAQGDEFVRQKLNQAISNSRAKGYHGNADEVNKVPPMSEQAQSWLTEKHDIFEFYEEEKKQWIDAKSDKWKAAVLKRYQWVDVIRQQHKADSEPTPAHYAEVSDKKKVDGEYTDYKKRDPLAIKHA
jgi:hypothetical protein